MNAIADFRRFLDQLPEGPIDTKHIEEVRSRLGQYWNEFEGATATDMAPHKVSSRADSLEWHPPLLTFEIERHGAVVLGSTRASVQCWTANLQHGRVTCADGRARQIEQTSKRLDIAALVAEVAASIRQHRHDDAWLVWKGDDLVQVAIGAVIPLTVRQTTADRRKRFRRELAKALAPDWVPLQSRNWRFQRSTQAHSQ